MALEFWRFLRGCQGNFLFFLLPLTEKDSLKILILQRCELILVLQLFRINDVFAKAVILSVLECIVVLVV